MKYEIREMFPVVCIDYSVGSDTDRQFVATIECSDWKDIFFREKLKVVYSRFERIDLLI